MARGRSTCDGGVSREAIGTISFITRVSLFHPGSGETCSAGTAQRWEPIPIVRTTTVKITWNRL
jgi:hypothetical protein